MPNNKYVVKIDKDAKRLKRIFDDLAVNRECMIQGNDPEWNGPLRSFGIINKKKNLVENGFLDPVWVNINNQNNVIENRLIRLKPDVDVEKIEGNNKIFFKFRRRRLI